MAKRDTTGRIQSAVAALSDLSDEEFLLLIMGCLALTRNEKVSHDLERLLTKPLNLEDPDGS